MIIYSFIGKLLYFFISSIICKLIIWYGISVSTKLIFYYIYFTKITFFVLIIENFWNKFYLLQKHIMIVLLINKTLQNTLDLKF